MSVAQTRGGIPYVFRDTIDITGRKIRIPFYGSYLKARNQGAAPLKLYFTEGDFTDDANYVVVPTSTAATPYGEWSGPTETEDVWVRGDGGSTGLELVVFQRRG